MQAFEVALLYSDCYALVLTAKHSQVVSTGSSFNMLLNARMALANFKIFFLEC